MSSSLPPEGDPPQRLREAKDQLRRRVDGLRRALRAEERTALSREACERLCREPGFERAHTVCAYMPLPFELDVSFAVEAAFARGKRVALPRVQPDGRTIRLHLYEAGDLLVQSGFKVHEPPPSAPLVEDADVDLVVVPGLAFDAQGGRLGFGKGFYDRLLPRLRGAERTGVGFDFQLLEESVPHDDRFDVPVHRFVSDARSLVCERVR